MITIIGPVVAPAEPTTPTKPSEALRLGRLLRPRRIEGTYWDKADGACAIGAMSVGFGLADGGGAERVHHWPKDIGMCPSGDDVIGYAGYLVVHLNDDHHWSDDQIVAWLESLGL